MTFAIPALVALGGCGWTRAAVLDPKGLVELEERDLLIKAAGLMLRDEGGIRLGGCQPNWVQARGPNRSSAQSGGVAVEVACLRNILFLLGRHFRRVLTARHTARP
jgi:hypothetical protein